MIKIQEERYCISGMDKVHFHHKISNRRNRFLDELKTQVIDGNVMQQIDQMIQNRRNLLSVKTVSSYTNTQ